MAKLAEAMEEKEIVRANRIYREEQYRMQRERDWQDALARDAQLYAIARQEYERQKEVERARYGGAGRVRARARARVCVCVCVCRCVVRCGVVWCGVVWCGVVWCGMV